MAIAALACSGAVTLNNNVTLGNSTSRDITFTGSLASSIPIKTTRSYDIGSADLGLRAIYLGMNSTHTILLQAPSSGASADYTIELPATVGVIGQGLVKTSTSALGWAPNQYTTNAVSSADYTVLDNDGYKVISVTTGSTTRTVTLPTLADNQGRTITIVKADSGTGFVVIDGEGAETVGGATGKTLLGINDSMTVYGAPTTWVIQADNRGTEAISWTPTGSWTAGVTYTGQVQFIKGYTLRFKVLLTFTAAPTPNGGCTITLPFSWAIKTAQLLTTSRDREVLGHIQGFDGSDYIPIGFVTYESTTQVRARYHQQDSTWLRGADVTHAVPAVFANTDTLTFVFDIPIDGI